MADNPPITTSVPEIVTTDTGADPETVGTLTESFADFWKEEDAKTEGAPPPAPEAEGAAQETKKEARVEKLPEPKAEPRREPTKPPAPTIVDSDDDIDKLEMVNNADPKLVEHFGRIKDLWKQDRAKARAMREEVEQLNTALSEARNNAWTPEAKADYEHAAAIRRRFDFASDPEFQARFHQPIFDRYQEVLNEIGGALPVSREEAQGWVQQMQNWNPDGLDKNYWLNKVLNRIQDPIEYQNCLSRVTELMRMQRERDAELNRRTGDRSAFDRWIQEKTQTTAQRVQEEIMNEIGTQEQRIAPYLPRNIDEAKTKEEREAISVHNERFEKLNGVFKEYMHDLSKNGPRAWVRASVEATRAQIVADEYKQLESELKSAKQERDKYKAELDKIHGARRKLATTPAAPAAPRKDGETSIKDLGNVRKAFDSYWSDIDSK